ncbi:MAG: amino-acid N-acetyltransferase [Thioalkalispiraceae bacterium]|jgi:amino-acid N-acetyltransferase
MREKEQQQQFVEWFRHSSPYIRAFRGRTFVITFGGEMLTDAQFPSLVHDLVLLNSLGIRLVLVHGARPQINKLLKERKLDTEYAEGMRVTTDAALECLKQAAGSVRVEIEALLSMGISDMPLHKLPTRVVSGNFVTAQPLGIHDGVDFCHTGEIRRIDTDSINWHLEDNNIVLLSPMGYSATGEVYNLTAEAIAAETARQIKADKLILMADESLGTGKKGSVLHELTQDQAKKILTSRKKLNETTRIHLEHALKASEHGVNRVHIINRHIDGGLLLELFTRDGVGSMLSAHLFEDIRKATIDDIGGILDLIKPLEEQGQLVRRSREMLEMEIQHFTVIERDGLIVGCAAFYPYLKEHLAELACLAVHPDYRREGRGHELFDYIVKRATQLGIHKLFVLTTRTSDWFRERGFKSARLDDLPVKKRSLYNYQRQSKVYLKDIR